MLKDYELYTHVDTDINTVSGFLSDRTSVANAFNGDKSGFLNYEGDTGTSNLDRIYSKYTEDDKKIEKVKDSSIELLKPNTELIIPKSTLNKELQIIRGKNQLLEQKDFKAFYGQSLLQLLKDPLYSQKIKYKYGDRNESFNTLFPHISVWIYIGAIDSVVNISKFIQSCNISNAKAGGSFEMTLPPIVELDSEYMYEFEDQVYSNSSLYNDVTGKNNQFYFHKLIQANDIVFIKFEELEIERQERLTSFILSKNVLAKQFYDMIGLVDENNINSSFANNDVSIRINGRNMMKLLIDDGSYFFPLLFVDGSQNTFVNLQQDNKLLKRTFSSGSYDILFSYSYRSIADTIQFIVNQLSNLGVVENNKNLFTSYGGRRTRIYRLDNEDNATQELHNGIWQINKLLIDENISDRVLSDPSISQPNGSIVNQFYKICQDPFVEFFVDTYGDFNNFIVRQPPFTGSQIRGLLDGVATDKNIVKAQKEGLVIPSDILNKYKTDIVLTVETDDVLQSNLKWEDEQIYSWYELQPQGAFLGQRNNIPLAYLPIIYFPEYANKWGSRRLSTVSNYISYEALTGNNTDNNRDKFKEAVINDYKYLLDSHIYLPFTRKGSITINGDRRFKIGTWIRFEATGEIFYVDGVSNNFSVTDRGIDRVTTLNVSRGMVEKYTRGDITYFNIVNTDYIKKTLIDNLTSRDIKQNKPRVNVKSNFLVNKDIFDFFYQRQQFNE